MCLVKHMKYDSVTAKHIRQYAEEEKKKHPQKTAYYYHSHVMPLHANKSFILVMVKFIIENRSSLMFTWNFIPFTITRARRPFSFTHTHAYTHT